ncbi:hypothetical protein Pmani_015314 [Petrolisthes manimaculis]|uniref:Reverse transcriptase n=1 Tax=Petrolisthes manimaculis TaxID=1843537 RepID=A0AAE1UA07_9EUCA|nr:hypothetical protein Pmani_027868 [Petrolisthes manimaculis]KAK4313326.1 hypothetical protein Pmani_015314 [Petrolisthes manimaculis]
MMFADDLKLCFHLPVDTSLTISRDLQRDINTLVSTAASWGLKFTPNKCVHLCFKRGQDLNAGLYTLDGNPITRATSHKDLGVLIDVKLRFHPHIRQTVAKAGDLCCYQPTEVNCVPHSNLYEIIVNL